MSLVEILVILAYVGVLLVLSVYGSHRYYMAYLYYRHKFRLPTPRRRFDRVLRTARERGRAHQSQHQGEEGPPAHQATGISNSARGSQGLLVWIQNRAQKARQLSSSKRSARRAPRQRTTSSSTSPAVTMATARFSVLATIVLNEKSV